MTGTTVNFSDIFLAFIADHTKDFTGREWVFAEIDHWLADPRGHRSSSSPASRVGASRPSPQRAEPKSGV